MTDYTLLRQHLRFANIPKPEDLVYKEEDAYSFDTPESEDGLFISLTSFIAFNRPNALLNYRKTGQPLYLNYKRRLIPKTTPERTEEPPKKKPTILGIGVEGGFQTEEKEYDEEYALVVLPEFTYYEITTELPEKIYLSIIGIQNAREAFKQEQQTAWVAGGPLVISQYAQNLKQLDNGVKIPPAGWKCSQCDKTDNLWLNLTDGTILCGRRYFDGSGGNNHAVEYYQKTGYPLAVKLGTITPHGADVYSYVEDDMVEDPNLKEHLAHWGINVYEMEKTEKTMAELEVDLNFSWDWMKIQEKGKALVPLRGPGYTPLKNFGNTCYMNSILQALFSRKEFRERYANNAKQIFEEISDNPCTSFPIQMAKLGDGLISGKYSDREEGIGPRTLKSIIGKGHAEFSTMRQQDALEFLQYLITLIQRDEHVRQGLAVSPLFTFKVEEKLQCLGSQKVKYSYRDDNALLLSIPTNRAINKDEVDAKLEEMEKLGKEGTKQEKPRYRIPFAFCLETFVEPEEISNFRSSATGTVTTAIKTSKFASFPRYLVIAMRRFIRGDDWVPKKLDALVVDVPDELDLESYRGKGIQPGEEVLPDEATPKPTTGPKADEGIVRALSEMGFAESRSRKAAVKTNNTGAEAAMNWLLEHMEDPDIDDPIEPSPAAQETESINEEGIAILISMGFTVNQAKKALKATNNNIERATDWIFSHTDELDDNAPSAAPQKQPEPAIDSSAVGRYKLFGLVSHIGASTHSGHYVCHLRSEEDGKWGLFNDEQLSVSEDPPKEMAYLYLYQRV